MDRDTDDGLRTRWLEWLGNWLAFRPTMQHPAGLAEICEDLCMRLRHLGFSVAVHGTKGAQPVLVASRPPTSGTRWVGLFAHYDVEQPGEGWSSDPFTLSVREDRVYGRGVADNLGPLALRLLTLASSGDSGHPGLLWVIQGEEEIGSPWAHRLFPHLALPPISLWLEETGYFEQDGTQRLLLRRACPGLAPVWRGLMEMAAAEGHAIQVHDRYLNKAFGEHRCPCLSHLVKEQPYLAIGPNDTRSRIHQPDESLPFHTLGVSSRQFLHLLHSVALCE